eukprot:COSAG06_NODE_30501_length_538_cov_0.464692_1_plen_162_part_10
MRCEFRFRGQSRACLGKTPFVWHQGQAKAEQQAKARGVLRGSLSVCLYRFAYRSGCLPVYMSVCSCLSIYLPVCSCLCVSLSAPPSHLLLRLPPPLLLLRRPQLRLQREPLFLRQLRRVVVAAAISVVPAFAAQEHPRAVRACEKLISLLGCFPDVCPEPVL